jgi:AmmeMemoRadiSam system protein B
MSDELKSCGRCRAEPCTVQLQLTTRADPAPGLWSGATANLRARNAFKLDRSRPGVKNCSVTPIRPACVAGFFYPDDPHTLEREVREFLAAAESKFAKEARREVPALTPKALIVPHAGYRYSGPVAASAYCHLLPRRHEIKRVILMGPSHRVSLSGLAATSADAFETPLGRVRIDRKATLESLQFSQVSVNDRAHAGEHSLEVQLPFLQVLLDSFDLVPYSVGDASDDEVAQVLAALWGGDETLIVISSDLSHYLPYAEAQARDAETTLAIEALRPEGLDWESACGRVATRGLLRCARERELAVHTLDVRNSGDTQGGRDRVVGYGAWAFVENARR